MRKNNKVEVWIRVEEDGNIPDDNYSERIRLIYPNGDSEWANGEYRTVGTPEGFCESCWPFYKPCWYKKGMTKKQSITAMKKYDKSIGYKTVKIGEL